MKYIYPLLILLTLNCNADFVGVVQKNNFAESSDGNIFARTPKNQTFPNSPGNCIMQVFKKSGPHRHNLIWRRSLINDYWPCEIFVTNNGEVITLDDQLSYGKHPVIIYDKIGRISYISRIQDFPELQTNEKILRTEAGLRWRESSRYFLSETTNCFVIIPPDKDPIIIKIPSGLRLSSHDKVPWDKVQKEIKQAMKTEASKP